MKKQSTEKKSEERSILEYFSRVYDDFPGGKIMESESPDFIVSPGPKQRIGIEITRLAQAKVQNEKYFPARINNHENDILHEARKIYYAKENSIPLFLSVAFRNELLADDDNIRKIALDLVEDVHEYTKNLDPGSLFSFIVNDPLASDYIDFIEGAHFPGVDLSTWINAGGYRIPAFNREYLVRKIHSKEKKLPLYRKSNLNFIWLILVTDSLHRVASFNIHNQLEAWHVNSEFDRVFLFPVIESKVYEIQGGGGNVVG